MMSNTSAQNSSTQSANGSAAPGAVAPISKWANVGVYYSGDDHASYTVTREHAREIRDSGEGWFINSGRDLRLKAAAVAPEKDGRDLREAGVNNSDESSRMGTTVMEANAGEKGEKAEHWARELVKAWKPAKLTILIEAAPA